MTDVAICKVAYRSRSGNVNELEEASLCHAYGALTAAGVDSQVFDFYLNASLKAEDLIKSGAKVILFYVRWPGEFWTESQKVIEELRAMPGGDKPMIGVFGEASVGQEKALRETDIQFVITGEEPELVQLVQAVLNGDDWKACSGIVYLQEDGTVKFNQGMRLVHNLDELPPARHYYLEYCKENGIPLDFMKAGIRTSRGCYARCKFCYITGYDNLYENYSWRGRSAKNIFEEVKYVHDEFGVTEIFFSDATFFGNNKASKERANELADLIIQSGIDIKFLIYTRANDVDYEVFKRLKEAGLYAVLMGLESFVPEKLKRYNKGTTVEQNKKALQVFKDLGIYMNLGFILFDKDTTIEELKIEMENLKELVEDKGELITNPSLFVRNIFTPYEGSRAEDDYMSIEDGDNRVLMSVMDGRLDELYARTKYGFVNERVAAIADAGWLFGRESGSQQYDKRLLQGKLIQRLLEDENDEEAMMLAEKNMEWRKELAKFTVFTFAEIVDHIAAAEDPVTERFVALDRAFEKFREYLRSYLGEEHAQLRWYDDYLEIKRKAQPATA
jgi:radical SAM superfamily enzyme YgiQ (UPF0313 family)